MSGEPTAEPIAIIGMSGRFPGAADTDAFWNNLVEGVESIARFSSEDAEYSVSTPEAVARGEKFVGARGLLDNPGLFDAEFFGIYPREAELMDPQHRIFLECAWEAVEAAGWDPASYPGLIGVYAGLTLNTYLLYNLAGRGARLAGNFQVNDYQVMTGNDKDFLPTRVAYKMNLRGPAMAVQTACSTSLVAVVQACRALQTWECDMALAGGVSVSFPQKRDYRYIEEGMVSPDGVCRSFDAAAAGTVFGHGCAVVLLKRLSDAQKDGDPIQAVIRGAAVNNDGSEKMGYAAPSVAGQAEVIAMAQAAAGVAPEEISYVEAHGTGTPLGDPIEVAALTRAFRDGGAEARGFCALGTGKTHIGHLDVAAGATGLIKTVLQLNHETIPPLLHFKEPNPRIDFASSPFYPVTSLLPWKRGEVPRRAGVSAFGVGGTNAHVIVEEAPRQASLPSPRRTQLLLLSARSVAALERMARRLADHLEAHPDLDLADVSFTLALGRRGFGFRRAIVAADRAEAIRLLREPAPPPQAGPDDLPKALDEAMAALAAASDPAPWQQTLGDLWIAGATPDWNAYFGGESRRRVALPTYPFERELFWIEPEVRPETSDDAGSDEEIRESTPPKEIQDPKVRATELVTALIEELSGQPVPDPDAKFTELGFDSLFLTQVSQALLARHGVQITFRQLLGESSSVTALAARLAGNLPPETAASTAPKSVRAISGLPVVRRPGGAKAPTEAPRRFGPYKPVERGSGGTLTPRQRAALEDLMARYTRRTAGSKAYTAEHRPHYADPRAVAGFHPLWKDIVYPIVSERSKGALLWDVDGNEYVDLTMGFGTYFFGHSPDWLIEALDHQLAKGIEIGPQSAVAGGVARDICEFSGMDRATFCNTGSEAVMAAIRLARTVTGRSRVVYFTGDYHGMFDEVLVRGSWVNGEYRAQPIAPGIPPSLVENMLILDYAAPESLEILRAHADELAAVLVEPVQGRNPGLQPGGFLRELRDLTTRAGAALIFDEIVTGFRCHPGGAQAHFGIRADMATYGKVLGGGIPIGILAGKRQFMDALDGGAWNYGDDSFPEVGVTFFAGTFVRHPLAMTAARAVLDRLRAEGPGLQLRMTERADLLCRTLNERFEAAGAPLRLPHFSTFAMIDHPQDLPFVSLLWFYLREKGIHIWEGRPTHLTLAHTDEHLDRIIRAFDESVAEMQEAGFLPGRPAGAPLGLPSAFPREDRAPTTAAQREIWASVQMGDNANRAYNESCLIAFDGPMDRDALERALLLVVQRHPALRSAFSADGMEQSFHPIPDHLDLPITDLSRLPKEEQTAQIESLRADCTAHIFNLHEGPLVLLHLLVLGGERHDLLFTAHHLVCDGWSLGMIVDEFSRAYNAFRADGIPMLPAPFPFGAYARAEKEDPAQRDYWVSLFKDPPPALDLPLDHPRPPLKSYAGAMEVWELDRELFARVKAEAPRLGGTVFTVLFSAFAALIHRLSGQEDLVIGIPSAGQTLTGHDALVGHCLNFLPVRLPCAGLRPFRDFSGAVADAVLEAYENQSYTFGSLVRELQLPRDTSRLPLVSVMFNIDKSGFDRLRFDGMTFHVSTNAKQFVNFEIFFNLVQSEDQLLIECEYNTDLFAASSIRRWLASYEALVRAALNHCDAPLDELSIMDSKQAGLLEAWNATRSEYPRDKTALDLIRATAEANPERIAIVADTATLTYRALMERAKALAGRLQAAGVQPGDLVGLFLERTTDMPAGLLAIWACGAAYVPMDPAFPKERLKFMIEDAHMRAILTQSALAAELPDSPSRVVLADADDATPPFRPIPTSSRQTAYVIFTSGSTGRPKGVRIPHQALVNFLVAMSKEPGLSREDTLLSVTTLSFDISALEIFLPLLMGARVVIASRETTMDGNLLVEAIERHGITVLQATPVTWRLLQEAGWRGKSDLRALVGGEAVPRDLVNRLCALVSEVWNVYGPTETTIWSTCGRLEAGEGSVPIGRPIANTTVHIVNPTGQLQPLGVPGELWIGGEGLAEGYHERPDLTADRFLPSPFEPGGRIYRTGDLARWTADGQLECLGRMDTQVKVRGHRIELGEIEAALAAHPAIAQAVASVMDGRLVAHIRSAESSGGIGLWRDQWDALFESAIAEGGVAQLDQLDTIITGWAGDTGAQVTEWIESTVNRLRPLTRGRVLEIGCGTGQLLSRLAPHAEEYWAADFSKVAIEALTSHGLPANARLFQRAADDFSDWPERSFDLILINSVIQYFPGAAYLEEVLEGAQRLLKPEGCLFLGDIQGAALLPAHHAELLRGRVPAETLSGEFRAQVAHRVARETEFCLDPAWFGNWAREAGWESMEILSRRGQLLNETTAYHYDVILRRTDKRDIIPPPRTLDWKRDVVRPERLRAILEEMRDPVCVIGIPDRRIAQALAFSRALNQAAPTDPLPDWPAADPNATDAETLFALAEECGCRAHVRWQGNGLEGLLEAVFLPMDMTARLPNPPLPAPSGKPLCNAPVTDSEQNRGDLVPTLRAHLASTLPDYMIPSAFVFLDAFPLTPNGKVDRKALPAPDFQATVKGRQVVAPRNEGESQLLEIWKQVLGKEDIGVEDDIFEAGGDSIFIFQITARAVRAGLKITPAQVFQYRTISKILADTPADIPKMPPSIRRVDRNAFRRPS